MGQALARNYERYAEPIKNRVQRFRSYHSQLKSNNNDHNDDYYIENIKSKIDKLREYLKHNYDLNYEKDINTKNEGVQVMNDRKYTVKEVSEMLGVSVRTVEKYISVGKLAVEWGKGKTGKIRLITSEALQVMKENEAVKHDMNRENCEPVDRSVIRENGITEIIEPQKYSQPIQQPIPIIDVTRNIMSEVDDKIATALSEQQKFFTESTNLLRQDNQELRDKIDHIETRQKEIDIENRTSRIEKYISEMRDRQKLPWWRKLFSR